MGINNLKRIVRMYFPIRLDVWWNRTTDRNVRIDDQEIQKLSDTVKINRLERSRLVCFRLFVFLHGSPPCFSRRKNPGSPSLMKMVRKKYFSCSLSERTFCLTSCPFVSLAFQVGHFSMGNKRSSTLFIPKRKFSGFRLSSDEMSNKRKRV